MGAEIERRFLVFEPPHLDLGHGVSIAQGYLVFGHDGSEVRIRRHGELHTLTVKRGLGLVREETEIEISAEQFKALWPETAGRRLVKQRYTVPSAAATIELDVYEGHLAGLLVAEVEFPSLEASQAFEPPAWCGREVTEDARFRNRSVVALSVDELRGLLRELGVAPE